MATLTPNAAKVGKSLTAIANGLNADRVPTAQGGRAWYPATIRHTLKPNTLTPTRLCRLLRILRQ